MAAKSARMYDAHMVGQEIVSKMKQYEYGVLGLAHISDGDTNMVPHIDEFKADEIKYLSYWRERPKLQTSPRYQE
jgi:hypothetical protein